MKKVTALENRESKTTLDDELAAAYIRAVNARRTSDAELFVEARSLLKHAVKLAKAVTAQKHAKEILHICEVE